MAEITPHLRTQLAMLAGKVVLRMDVEIGDTALSVALDEAALWRLAETVKNAIDAASGKRIPAEKRRRPLPARQGP